MAERLTLRRPDDWHLHLRDGAMLEGVAGWSAAHFARAIVMPNLVPPVVTGADAARYRARILAALPAGAAFEPLMTLYLTEETDPEDAAAAAASGLVRAVKLYPAGATTNSASGVRDFDRVIPVLERMAGIGLPLCVHGEVADPEIDIFDREAVFIERILEPLRRRVPGLRVVLEHVTTAEGVAYVREGGDGIAGTLTAHHLIINRNHMLAGGIRPHYYCLPVAKRERHRLALRAAAVSGSPRFFLGTDSAPHADHFKEAACGCAGCFTAPVALACLAHVFEAEGALERLEGFASLHGAAFYGLAPNEAGITLQRHDAPVAYPERIETGAGPVTVFDPGFPLHWRVIDESVARHTDGTHPKRVASRIRAIRAHMGWSQSELAKICGATPAAVGNWESGKIKPKIEYGSRLAMASGVTLDYLYAGLTDTLQHCLAIALGNLETDETLRVKRRK